MAEMKFEDAIKKLEGIVDALERGDLSLDASLARYEEGVKLSILCTKKLEAAKKKIEVLVKSSDDSFSLKPFGGGGLEDVAIKKGRTKRGKKPEEGSLF
jgi:exodeoxyribonuclease VII small subunit